MSNETVTADQKSTLPSNVPADTEKTHSYSPAQPPVKFVEDEKLRLAMEKVFRLHARLFEELAK